MKTNFQNIRGTIVPVPGHFGKNGAIDTGLYREHTAFLVSKGVKYFYLAKSASELEYMTLAERLTVTRTVAEMMGDSCILMAQALGNTWIDEQVEEANLLVENGAHAVVVAPRGIKEGNKFFSSFYERAHYAPERHNPYYKNYMEEFASRFSHPIVYHNVPFKSGKGPTIDLLDKIVSIDNVVGLKEHVPDPLSLHRIYSNFGGRVMCFDGFGKTIQFWSLQWGAAARHSCWSWFDPDGDVDFFESVTSGNYSRAAQIVNSQWPVANVISRTGFQGYKHIMKLLQLPSGWSRIPGETLNESEMKLIEASLREIGLLV